MKRIMAVLIAGVVVVSAGCATKHTFEAGVTDPMGFTAPTRYTAETNAKVSKELPFSDQSDFEQANRGLIARDDSLTVKGDDGRVIWDQTAYSFVRGDAPDSVNPSLWRQERLNAIHGLFKVTDGIYQVRGYDFANMTLIEGKTGWIVVDPLTAKETAAKALAFARKHLGDRPVSAILFTHSHIDHFGGVLGIMSAEEARAKGVRVVAPEGFMEEATSENILAGPTMIRRSGYMYGKDLPRTERGHVGSGLGKGPAYGTVGILEPTDTITGVSQDRLIDGVRFVFRSVPDSEAPAEYVFYLPDQKAFCGAEVVSRQMHNLYTLRGAKVRDALAWSNGIEGARLAFSDADVYFGCHHWPIWGKDRIDDFLRKQRDTYKFIHDQTVRMAHSGLTPTEIADRMILPESLRTAFSCRGYYGTVRHNARAVYQRYYGWFDGNPANLNPLPPEESSVRYVACMGGADAVLASAARSFEKGDYRWTAELLNHLVFAEPKNTEARGLLARTYDQLGYQSESGPWRDIYLTGAYELRHGAPKKGFSLASSKEMMRHTSLDRFFDAMAAALDGPAADGKAMTLNFVFTDLNQCYVVTLENAVLHYRKGEPSPNADATLKLTHDLYLNIVLGIAKFKDIAFSGDLRLEGSKLTLIRFFSLLDKPDMAFNIVEP
jgi:alkyl sulfatase BDS1-like metallo-beta-lactamase superfamily hydrolase